MIWPNKKVLAHFFDFKSLLHFQFSSLTSRPIIKKFQWHHSKPACYTSLVYFVLSSPFCAATMLYKNNYRRQSVTKHVPVRVQFHLQLLLKLVSYLLQGAPGVFHFLMPGDYSWSNSQSYFLTQLTLSPCTMWLLT